MQIADEIRELIPARRYRTPVNERGYSQPGSGTRAAGYFFQDGRRSDRRAALVAEMANAGEHHRNAVLIGRRDHVLQYIDGLIAQFGEDKVLALP